TSGPGSTPRALSPPCWRRSDARPLPKIWRSSPDRRLFHRISTDFLACGGPAARIAVDGQSAPAYAQIVPRPTFLLALVSPIRQREKALAPTPGLFFAGTPPCRCRCGGRRTAPMAVKGARLDLVLVKRGLVPSRARAQDMIRRGLVAVAGKIELRPGAGVGEEAPIAVAGAPQYVSRGGLKLAAALDHFGFPVAGVVALDIGASTGGFTEVLLARGAARVYAVDVGHGQLDLGLARLPAVVSLQGQDARALDATLVP